MAFLLSYRSRGQLVDEPRFQGRQWIWISFRLAWISFRLAWISFRQGLDFLPPGLEFLPPGLEFVPGGLGGPTPTPPFGPGGSGRQPPGRRTVPRGRPAWKHIEHCRRVQSNHLARTRSST